LLLELPSEEGRRAFSIDLEEALDRKRAIISGSRSRQTPMKRSRDWSK
jgi:hypothetical protein